jgi:hypothetical protein
VLDNINDNPDLQLIGQSDARLFTLDDCIFRLQMSICCKSMWVKASEWISFPVIYWIALKWGLCGPGHHKSVFKLIDSYCLWWWDTFLGSESASSTQCQRQCVVVAFIFDQRVMMPLSVVGLTYYSLRPFSDAKGKCNCATCWNLFLNGSHRSHHTYAMIFRSIRQSISFLEILEWLSRDVWVTYFTFIKFIWTKSAIEAYWIIIP